MSVNLVGVGGLDSNTDIVDDFENGVFPGPWIELESVSGLTVSETSGYLQFRETGNSTTGAYRYYHPNNPVERTDIREYNVDLSSVFAGTQPGDVGRENILEIRNASGDIAFCRIGTLSNNGGIIRSGHRSQGGLFVVDTDVTLGNINTLNKVSLRIKHNGNDTYSAWYATNGGAWISHTSNKAFTHTNTLYLNITCVIPVSTDTRTVGRYEIIRRTA